MADSSNPRVGLRRLSKPRTNKSSSNLLAGQPSAPSSPHNSSDQDYFGRDAVVVDSHGERRSRSKSRGRIKAYLYGSSHDALQTSSDDEDAQAGIAGAARDVRKRLSRTGSSITSFQSAKASVTRLSNSSSSRLLSTCSTESQDVDTEESAMIANQIKERAYQDSLAAQNHVFKPIDEDKHVDSVMAPVRRKSLYTPGIATRNASDILRKPPKPSTDHDYYHDPSRPETSRLSLLATLNIGEDGRSTPSDLHYSQLGGLQLGTLRVTNGAGSPVPDDHRLDLVHRSATLESKSHDGFYTASEGSVNGDSDHATPLPTRGGSPLKYESKLEASNETDNQVPSNPGQSLPFERESSNESFPFSREKADQVTHFERGATGQSVRFREKTPSDILRLEDGKLDELLPPKGESSEDFPFDATKPNRSLPIVKEKARNPFSFERKSQNEIEHLEGEASKDPFSLKMSPSKPRRVEETTHSVSSPLKSETPDEYGRFEGQTLSKSLPLETRPSKTCPADQRMPNERFWSEGTSPNGASDIADEYIADIDSGPFCYPSFEVKRNVIPQSQQSAEEMWRSFINDAEVQHAGSGGGGSREDALRRLTDNAHMPSTWRPDRLFVPSSQPSGCSASSETRQTDSGYFSHAAPTGAPAHEVSFESVVDSTPPTKVLTSPPPQAVENIRSSARSSFRIPIRKLQKQRPKSQPPPVNLISVKQCHELNDVHIPRVPSVIAARHADRLRQFPLLEHTFQSSQHTTADKTLSLTQTKYDLVQFPPPMNALDATSVPLRSSMTASSKYRASTIVVEEDDGTGASDLMRSPSWSDFGGGREKKEQKKLAKEEKRLERRLQKEKKEDDKQRSARSRSASRRRSSSQHDPLVTIADFGTVTESLGNSPYDIATAISKPLSTSSIASNWHPHQMSTAMPRPKSMFGMDEAAAASDCARARRRNRSQSFGRPSVRQAVRISTGCGSHDSQATGDTVNRDKAFGVPSALPSLSIVNSTISDPTTPSKAPTSAPMQARPLDFMPGMPTQGILGDDKRGFRGVVRSLSLFIDAPSVPALAAVDLKAHGVNWARDRQRSQSFSTGREETFDDCGRSPEKPVRSHSVVIDDTPPVPALPSIQQVKQREAAIIRSRPHSMIVEAPVSIPTSDKRDQRKAIPHPPEAGTSTTPRKRKGSKIVPDLWSNGSLERKSPKTVERSRQASDRLTGDSDEAIPARSNLWETQSYAWSQRRKSAGEALLRNQVQNVFNGQEAAKSTPLDEIANRPPSRARASTSGTRQSFSPSPSHLGPFPNPLASHPQVMVQQPVDTSNLTAHRHQLNAQQTQLLGSSPLSSSPRPSVSASQDGNRIPSFTPRRAQTQSSQIPRKRVGSGPSILRTEAAIGSGRYEGVLV